MNEISGESLKSAIALKILGGFADVVSTSPLTLYKERMVQQIELPCFFIWTMDISQIRVGQNVYSRLYQMNVRYQSKDNNSSNYEELTQVGSILLEELRELQLPVLTPPKLGEIIPATEVTFNIVENVLQCFANYRIRGYFKKLTDEEIALEIKMQTLEQREVLKNRGM